jgi:hypothetical protein
MSIGAGGKEVAAAVGAGGKEVAAADSASGELPSAAADFTGTLITLLGMMGQLVEEAMWRRYGPHTKR